jgi:hypothetical protein
VQSNAWFLDAIRLDGAVSACNSLTVQSNAWFLDAIRLDGAVSACNSLTVQSNAWFLDAIRLDGAVSACNSLTVQSNAWFLDAIRLDGAVSACNSLTVQSNAWFQDSLRLDGAFGVHGDARFYDMVTVNGLVTACNGFFQDALVVEGKVTFSNSLDVHADVSVSNRLTTRDVITRDLLATDVTVAGRCDVHGSLYADMASAINLIVDGSTVTGSLIVDDILTARDVMTDTLSATEVSASNLRVNYLSAPLGSWMELKVDDLAVHLTGSGLEPSSDATMDVGTANSRMRTVYTHTVDTINGISQVSDSSLKETAPLAAGLAELVQIETVVYSWKDKGLSQGTQRDRFYGVKADQLRTIVPDIVVASRDAPLSLNYCELIPLIINAIKELSKQVNSLVESEKKIA